MLRDFVICECGIVIRDRLLNKHKLTKRHDEIMKKERAISDKKRDSKLFNYWVDSQYHNDDEE